MASGIVKAEDPDPDNMIVNRCFVKGWCERTVWYFAKVREALDRNDKRDLCEFSLKTIDWCK